MFEPSVVVPDELVTETARWFLFDRRQQLLLVNDEIPTAVDWSDGVIETHVLGVAGSVPVQTGRVTVEFEPPPGAEFVDLRSAFARLEEDDWKMAGRATQVLTWDNDHRFCGRCGDETQTKDGERARTCAKCRLMSFPRLTPAVITLVEREDGQALLAWGRQFPGRFFSALAGFVEPGESLEETVAREVREESGVEVSDIRYFASQPWPFPHSMMIGFNAKYVSGDLVIQESEIVEADWFSHDDLPPVPRGRMSIAGWLIEDWIDRMSS